MKLLLGSLVLTSLYSCVLAVTNNWAILVCTSRYWFNYRHLANIITVYEDIKKLGIPDENIILMNGLDVVCDSRNSFPGSLFNSANMTNELGDDIQYDYVADDVNALNLLKLLTNRHDPNTQNCKRLLTDENSNILMYFSGHGGDEFLKFQDYEEISSVEFALAFEEMHTKNRYKEILVIVDSCQASSLMGKIVSPNVIVLSSSTVGENSYAYTVNSVLGLSVIDRFTYSLSNFLKKNSLLSKSTNKFTLNDKISVHQFYQSLSKSFLRSTPYIYISPNSSKSLHQFMLYEFFQNNESPQLSIKHDDTEPFPYSQYRGISTSTGNHVYGDEEDGSIVFDSTSLFCAEESKEDNSLPPTRSKVEAMKCDSNHDSDFVLLDAKASDECVAGRLVDIEDYSNGHCEHKEVYEMGDIERYRVNRRVTPELTDYFGLNKELNLCFVIFSLLFIASIVSIVL